MLPQSLTEKSAVVPTGKGSRKHLLEQYFNDKGELSTLQLILGF